MKYVDENINEAVVDYESLKGCEIPIFLLKNQDVINISQIIKQNKNSELILNLKHETEFSINDKIIRINMRS